MKKPLKYALIGIGAVLMLGCIALFALPFFINVDKYKPEIEKLVTEQTGYPLSLGGDVSLSFFPWAGIAFEDLALGNPEGFTQGSFIKIKRFKTGLKLLPLLGGNVEVSTFIVEEPEIILERSKDGRWNWEGFTNKTKGVSGNEEVVQPTPKETTDEPTGTALPIKSIAVGEFSITDGKVLLVDNQMNSKRELSDFSLLLTDISFDKPIGITSSWFFDGKPFSINGELGPVGKKPGSAPLTFGFDIAALDLIKTTITGKLENAISAPIYDIKVTVASFNPKEASEVLGIDFPVLTSDSSAITNFSVDSELQGSATTLTGSKTVITLDDSVIQIVAKANNFTQPDLDISLDINQMNIDRYLPPITKEEATGKNQNKEIEIAGKSGTSVDGEAPKNSAATPATKEKIDYTPLRQLTLALKINLKNISVHGGNIDAINLDITGRDGIFTINSLNLNLYDGSIATSGQVSFKKDAPEVQVKNETIGLQVGPLLRDFAQKDILEGSAKIVADIQFSGDQPDAIKKSLDGKGSFVFEDGAIIGLDLAQLARQIKSGFTLDQQGERPKTDFAELLVPFTLTKGLFNTEGTLLKSPFLRVSANGNANIVNETINMKVKPKVVGSMKGQGDSEDRSGVAIPIIVSGTFQKPEFSPDLEGLIKDEIPDAQEIQKIIETGEVPEDTQNTIKEGQKLFKNLFGN